MPHPIPTEEKSPRFVEVALPVPVHKLFTYRIPPGLAEVMQQGARVLVPFGKQTLTGYISNFRNEIDPGSELTEDEVKDIIKLQDADPLVTEEILELTKWAAEYYAASWGEMLKASLPAGINTATEGVVSITDAGRNELSKKGDSIAAKWAFLELIADNGELTEREILKALGNTSRYRISKLARSGLVAVRERTVAT